MKKNGLAAWFLSPFFLTLNLFIGNFEQNLLCGCFQNTPLVWFRFIDDILIIWNGKVDSLDRFIFSEQNYSKFNNSKF